MLSYLKTAMMIILKSALFLGVGLLIFVYCFSLNYNPWISFRVMDVYCFPFFLLESIIKTGNFNPFELRPGFFNMVGRPSPSGVGEPYVEPHIFLFLGGITSLLLMIMAWGYLYSWLLHRFQRKHHYAVLALTTLLILLSLCTDALRGPIIPEMPIPIVAPPNGFL